ncbi:ABC-type sugar transport system ATPase component [Gaiella occulta]|uniref:ABC-type sugar transport system ATPase component n=1 Tax=Gaiella occulta TaxID=1002870 RepID=A0A7M2YTI2_9ACTN|nr:sugar ABC transporter ATP-binding protein [Gaiella occulta]RDI73204.1 ABC-type sugar transport system ATPase component [Gaiella occulta]
MTGTAHTPPILLAEGMHKRYGGVHALRGATLSIRPAEIHALLGENGSGKSTMLKILSGQLQPDAGRIHFAGSQTSFRNPTDALRQGIATVTQETTLVPDLSIAENVFLGHRMALRGRFIDWRTTGARARAAIERLGVDLDSSLPVRRLRPDQQQMVEIARALSIDARVLILDEPTSSLTDDEVESLFRVVRNLRKDGVSTIFVSHRLDEVLELADRVSVLRDGHSVGEGAITELNRARLIQMMVGRDLEEEALADGRSAAEIVSTPTLRVRGLTLRSFFADVDLDVGAGEIVGLAGLVGAGRSELLEAIFGLRSPNTGTVEVEGNVRPFRSPRHAIRSRLGFVPADRKTQGLVLGMSVHKNLLMASTSRVPRLTYPRPARETKTVSDSIAALQIKTHSPAVPVSTLSGGNQQKVVLGKWLASDPSLLMLDEPTRGVDVGAKAEIYRLLRTAANNGIGVLVSSSETPELRLLCDRIAVMFRGRIVAWLSRDEATEARIAYFAGGHQ